VEIKMVLFLPRDSASVPVSRQVLDGCLETLGVTPDTRTDIALAPDGPVPPTAEHGRGLKIIDAVVDNVRLSTNERAGTSVHFEKALDWVPGAAGEQLLSADADR
jgi:serine/threonine-protein kinase RsbW